MPEITGIFISSKQKDILYFTEKNFNGVMRVKLSSFTSEVSKFEENNKWIKNLWIICKIINLTYLKKQFKFFNNEF